MRRNSKTIVLPALAVVAFAIALAAFGLMLMPAPAVEAQSAPTGVTARDGANAGEVVVSWTPAAGTRGNRVG